MSETETGRPEGRTQYSSEPEKIYDAQRRPGTPLGAGEYVHVLEGYLREWVCMGQCNIYIATARDQELKELISLYEKDVCDPNIAEMQELLESSGYTVPLPLDAAPTSTDPVQTEAINDTTIALGQWFATRAFMDLWHAGAVASQRTDVRDAFIRNYHRANRWHIAYHETALRKGYLHALPQVPVQQSPQ
ncbi:hypothetical protein Achl_4517 (plasmid) [Pseudarthrobacter chlorophenolicus A6]|uniref:Uncharacterized protein n=1 Tax=Pseudarthrobacter chlorophenolicus (strain ATCC 700700 / DSM 12829 / CIP 107037 / JCM 12360 / KCTC 9906 / NCIMB 13794 / A6) TaxID=452863 RepID=B8HJ70_PSECP|nr:DUF3231 family protein [Pseudarthrobacter chlorophenolicus]ACL42468.1 hypothetical protein Achl_4517 [Pseudarthrobacter chlorophenolicus A6]SDQ09778.1 Protein of unknown function [Pseudarthrobacter chlorophenolicus]